jgi:hypothetical protein
LIDLENGDKRADCLFYIDDFSSIGVNGINLDANRQFISLAVVNGPTFRNERNLNMMLLRSQLIELLLFQYLELKHPPHNQYKTDRE